MPIKQEFFNYIKEGTTYEMQMLILKQFLGSSQQDILIIWSFFTWKQQAFIKIVTYNTNGSPSWQGRNEHVCHTKATN